MQWENLRYPDSIMVRVWSSHNMFQLSFLLSKRNNAIAKCLQTKMSDRDLCLRLLRQLSNNIKKSIKISFSLSFKLFSCDHPKDEAWVTTTKKKRPKKWRKFSHFLRKSLSRRSRLVGTAQQSEKVSSFSLLSLNWVLERVGTEWKVKTSQRWFFTFFFLIFSLGFYIWKICENTKEARVKRVRKILILRACASDDIYSEFSVCKSSLSLSRIRKIQSRREEEKKENRENSLWFVKFCVKKYLKIPEKKWKIFTPEWSGK